jgi:DNA-directed RNA polymerase subunit M
MRVETVQFCPKCNNRLIMQQGEHGKKIFLVCPKCGYRKQSAGKPKRPQTSGSEAKSKIVVIGKKEQQLQTLPTAKVKCPKCGNNTAFTWQVQTRSGDEAATQFFRCTECSHTFRLYA